MTTTSKSPSQYEPLTSPSLPIGIEQFFSHFYSASDTPGTDAHTIYATRFFTPDAVLIMGSKRVRGTEEIINLRKGMWEAVKERSHTPVKIFSFDKDGEDDGEKGVEVMVHGVVGYVFKDGRRGEVEWAARAKLIPDTSSDSEGENAGWKMSFYQVYLDTAAMQNAK